MEEPISFDNWDFGKGFAWDSEDKGLPENMTVFDEDSSDFDFVDSSDDSSEEDFYDSDDSANGATAKDEESDSEEEESVDLGEVFLREYLGEDYDKVKNEGRGVTLDQKCEDEKKKRHRFKEGDSVKTRMDKNHGFEVGEIRKVDDEKGVYFIEFDETGVWDECKIDWVDKDGMRLDDEGYWIDEDGKTRLNDYSIGRWVTFPCVKMTGKVRKIIDEGRGKDFGIDSDEWHYVCEDPVKEHTLLPRICVPLNKENRRAYGTREEAEKGLKKEEEEHNKKYVERMEELKVGIS